jgi:hypothetical protein
MMRGGLHESDYVKKVYEPKTITGTVTDYNGHSVTTGDAVGIDLRGYDEAMVVLSLGAIAAGTLDVDCFDSDTDDGTAAAIMTDDAGTEIDFAQKGTADQNLVHLLRFRPKDTKRYLFIKVTNSSNDSKAFGINVILGKADKEPVTQDNTIDFNHSLP